MLGLMEESVIAMIRTWLSQVEINGGVADITVDKDLKRVSADIYLKLVLVTLTPKANKSLQNWKSSKELCLNRVFLDSQTSGHETTALTASWSLMLLALYPEWQERIRAEIFDICGDDRDCFQDLDKLRQLKSLTMVIQETLRLYGPAVITSREAFADLRVGDLTVPKGTIIWISVMALHRDPENWGPDADEFKPERFAGGVAEACKYPQSYIPFGFGSRLCVGQTFAMLELKILLRSILSNFSFSLSPEYRHSPVYKMLLAPQHGIRLLARRLQRENVMTQT
ncbi:hypothetical protein GH714_019743 [Hevea brasiliensis]|uniref:Cytochrome P450 n=1 Tax=Hevea brasiliensis TaxID=3981 RepID=A0A6A6M1V5_HEVBR|nr:hypothetical protein GH714_019743 [Hevea brasiliensis]